MKALMDTQRGGGKTTAIMELFIQNECQLLVMSQQERERIIEVYHVPEERQKDIISWAGPNVRQELVKSHSPIYIDNVEHFLERFLQRPVEWVTFTTDLPEPTQVVWTPDEN